MDFIDYQKYLNNQWKQIEQRIKDDDDIDNHIEKSGTQFLNAKVGV